MALVVVQVRRPAALGEVRVRRPAILLEVQVLRVGHLQARLVRQTQLVRQARLVQPLGRGQQAFPAPTTSSS